MPDIIQNAKRFDANLYARDKGYFFERPLTIVLANFDIAFSVLDSRFGVGEIVGAFMIVNATNNYEDVSFIDIYGNTITCSFPVSMYIGVPIKALVNSGSTAVAVTIFGGQ